MSTRNPPLGKGRPALTSPSVRRFSRHCGNFDVSEPFRHRRPVRGIAMPSSACWGWSWSSSCGRQSVDQFVLGIGPPFGTHDQTFSCSFFSVDSYVLLVTRAPSLTRGRVCSLQCNRSLVRAVTPNNYTLPSHLRLFSFCRLLRLAGTAVEVF
jgi:hypothetical protein